MEEGPDLLLLIYYDAAVVLITETRGEAFVEVMVNVNLPHILLYKSDLSGIWLFMGHFCASGLPSAPSPDVYASKHSSSKDRSKSETWCQFFGK